MKSPLPQVLPGSLPLQGVRIRALVTLTNQDRK